MSLEPVVVRNEDDLREFLLDKGGDPENVEESIEAIKEQHGEHLFPSKVREVED